MIVSLSHVRRGVLRPGRRSRVYRALYADISWNFEKRVDLFHSIAVMYYLRPVLRGLVALNAGESSSRRFVITMPSEVNAYVFMPDGSETIVLESISGGFLGKYVTHDISWELSNFVASVLNEFYLKYNEDPLKALDELKKEVSIDDTTGENIVRQLLRQ